MNFYEMGVVELTKRITDDLKSDTVLDDLCVRGEISNFKMWNPHAYFSLKEGKALINCVMFNAAYKIKSSVDEGILVKAYGSVRVYAQRGVYQLYVEKLELEDNLGELYRRFEELKSKLQKEGIFDKPKKKVPRFPKTIAVVASRTSAAYQDVLKTVKKRYPLVRIKLFHTGVQGKSAVAQVVRALSLADKSGADVVLLVRGGGSIEDLWNFNEEVVVRKIYEMKAPVVTGVGHEIDTTLADYVADVRAPTPTGAAEFATPELRELEREVDHSFNSIFRHAEDKIALLSSKLEKNKKRLDAHSPWRTLELKRTRIENSFNSIVAIMKNSLSRKDRELKMAFFALKRARAIREVEMFSERIENMFTRMEKGTQNMLEKKTHVLREMNERLKGADPNAPLKKGYAIIFKGKKVVSTTKEIADGDKLDVFLRDGRITARVEEVQRDER